MRKNDAEEKLLEAINDKVDCNLSFADVKKRVDVYAFADRRKPRVKRRALFAAILSSVATLVLVASVILPIAVGRAPSDGRVANVEDPQVGVSDGRPINAGRNDGAEVTPVRSLRQLTGVITEGNEDYYIFDGQQYYKILADALYFDAAGKQLSSSDFFIGETVVAKVDGDDENAEVPGVIVSVIKSAR